MGDDPYLDNNAVIEETRRNLVHWEQQGKLQFITFHLADSLPKYRLQELVTQRQEWLDTHPQPWSPELLREYHKLFSSKVDGWLDNGYGACVLNDKRCAKVVANAINFFDGQRYIVHTYVIMPNHVHAMIEMLPGHRLSDTLHSWKSFTANEINKLIGGCDKVWHSESWDRIVRNETHYDNIRKYILKNYLSGGIIYK